MKEARESFRRAAANSAQVDIASLQKRVAELEVHASTTEAIMEGLWAEIMELRRTVRTAAHARMVPKKIRRARTAARRSPKDTKTGNEQIVAEGQQRLAVQPPATAEDTPRAPPQEMVPSTSSGPQDRPPSTRGTTRAVSEHPIGSEEVEDDENSGWYLEYSAPPATAMTMLGGFSLESLMEHLSLDDEIMRCIGSLQTMQGTDMRLHVELNMVFIHDPIILESPDKTYLIGWAPRETNRDTVAYLTNGTSRAVALHVFSFRPDMDGWCYFGLHIVTPVQLDLEWSWNNLGKKDAHMLAGELKKRWNSDISPSEITSMLQSGQLEQCCFELSSTGLESRTRSFVIDTDLEDSAGTR
ncbi:hypothetical protein OBBRIDRAFT_193495 [Obba rivulosa]|uniref:Uncharacterized protein n=1 Tax=Obba rivulosa TaxID=1052685 RepID=A0A8E2DHD8_9APHY|nr:hypothetical protein OBBRIDRAFT_193495 [Obba rivulosa]